MCIVRSVFSEAINHDPAHMFMNTGSQIAGRPSMGAWATYGLGSEAQNLPGFVVLTSNGRGGQNQPIAARQWAAGFLPSRYQGVHLRGKGDPVMYLNAPPGVNANRQQDVVDTINQLNRQHDAVVHDPALGSDFDGAVTAPFDVTGLPQVTQALLDFGFDEAKIEAVMGGNVRRLLERLLP